jgi:pimeloyl-ACP methyl ester carboxylesterase
MPLVHDETGTGRPVVLLHAFPLCRALWAPQHAGLSGCRLLTPDLPGFGDSPLLDGTPTVDAFADAVAGWLDQLGIHQPVVLGGLSMGGYVCFAFVRRHAHRLAGLILADTRAEADDDTARANRDRLIGFAATNPAHAVIEQMLPRLLGASTLADQPAIVERVRSLGAAQRPAGILAALQLLRNRPDSTPTLASIRVPTLVLVGREDVLTPPSLAEQMVARIPQARLAVIEKAGHLANIEQPDAFNRAVAGFLQDLK